MEPAHPVCVVDIHLGVLGEGPAAGADLGAEIAPVELEAQASLEPLEVSHARLQPRHQRHLLGLQQGGGGRLHPNTHTNRLRQRFPTF